MLIFGYIISNGDEAPVLPDAIDSLASFCDRIFLVDGGLGGGTLNHHPEYTKPIKEWLSTHPNFYGYRMRFFTLDTLPWSNEEIEAFKKAIEQPSEDVKIVKVGDMTLETSGVKWLEVPIKVFEHQFQDPAAQRNWTLNKIWEEPEQCDWLVMLDSDEVYSYEAERGMRDYLATLSGDTIGVYQKWLNLVQDEQHCLGGHHSDWLSHPRIMRPKMFYFEGSWHEPMVCDRSKLARWDTRIIHSRSLFRRRLLVQRGHPTIKERSVISPEKPPFHADAWIESIPAGVTWRPLHWPEGERVIGFNDDTLLYWDEHGIPKEYK